jgi:uncharacterized membrane protein
MKHFKIIIAIVLLTVSLFLLFNNLFAAQPIQIVLETGQEVTTEDPSYFSLAQVLLLVISSFFIGSTASYLYYNTDAPKVIKSLKKGHTKKYEMVAPLLKSDEKKVFLILQKAKGEMLQNKLVTELGWSKVKVTRVVQRLAQKELIVKERYGMTNKILLQ